MYMYMYMWLCQHSAICTHCRGWVCMPLHVVWLSSPVYHSCVVCVCVCGGLGDCGCLYIPLSFTSFDVGLHWLFRLSSHWLLVGQMYNMCVLYRLRILALSKAINLMQLLLAYHPSTCVTMVVYTCTSSCSWQRSLWKRKTNTVETIYISGYNVCKLWSVLHCWQWYHTGHVVQYQAHASPAPSHVIRVLGNTCVCVCAPQARKYKHTWVACVWHSCGGKLAVLYLCTCICTTAY